MKGLTPIENKIIRILHKTFKNSLPTKSIVMEFLTKKIALPKETAQSLYTLWWLNFQEDGDYSDIEINRDPTPIITLLKSIQSGNLDEDDIPEIFYGEKMNQCNGSYYSPKLPCVKFRRDTVILELDRDDWERVNISGLDEEDIYKYYESFDSSGYYHEFDNDEFYYIHFTDEMIDLIEQIAIHAKRNDIVNYLNGNDFSHEKIVNYLEELLPENDFDKMRDEWISDIGYITTEERSKAVRSHYSDNITYDVYQGNGSFELEIPMDEFIEIVEREDPGTFSDFLEMEINPEVYFEDIYWQTYYWDGEDTTHIDGLIKNLESFVEKYSDGNLIDYHDRIMKFKKLLDSTGIKESGDSDWSLGKGFKSKDGRLNFYENDVDFKNNTIKFTYDGIDHKIPLNDLVNWVYGSVLDLKESIKKILRKELLK